MQWHIKTNYTTWNLIWKGFKGSWLKNKSRVNSGSKFYLKFLETVCEEICFLSLFLSQVILLAYCHSFKMRYWVGLCDFRKNYKSCFCGFPRPNSIVKAKCKDSYFSFKWSKWVRKKILRKNLCCWSTFVFCSTLYSQF